MTLDYKKEYKEFYLPPKKPQIITIPKMNFVAVRGKGNPNDEEGNYKKAIAVWDGIAFTVKMSKKGNRKIDGYFDYVVPPLEGLWEQDGIQVRLMTSLQQFSQCTIFLLNKTMPLTSQASAFTTKYTFQTSAALPPKNCAP